MKLSVVIVNYNVKYYLEQCLYTLYKAIDTASRDFSTEVIVVDNASTDGSGTYIPQRFPKLTYIYNTENKGFSRANNQAIKQARGEYILLLNPDTVIPEDTLLKVVAYMDSHSKAGAAGVRMITGNGRFLPESKRGYPTLGAAFGKLFKIDRLFPNSKSLNGYYRHTLDENDFHQVEVLSGAFMMLRRSVLENIGFLDEDFFMYGEDIDLSCRILSVGYENHYLPYSILHYKGESTSKQSYKYIRSFYGAMNIFYSKHNTHTVVGHLLVHTCIYAQKYICLGITLIKSFLAPLQQTLRRLFKRESTNVRLLFFGKEESTHFMRSLLKRNGLTANHHFVVADENSTPKGHGTSFFSLEDYTHVVYDCSTYSFSSIIHLLSKYHKQHIQLGIYNPESRLFITPEKCYT